MIDLQRVDFRDLTRNIARVGRTATMAQAARRRDWSTLWALDVSRRVAECLGRLNAECTSKPYSSWGVEKAAIRHVKPYALFYDWATTNDIPVVMYLRAQVEMRGALPYPNTLRGPVAQQMFQWWVEKQERRSGCVADLLERLGAWHFEDLTDPFEDWRAAVQMGEDYLARIGGTMSRDLLIFLEQSSLPGPFLVTDATMLDLYATGELPADTMRRMRRAMAVLGDRLMLRLEEAGVL